MVSFGRRANRVSFKIGAERTSNIRSGRLTVIVRGIWDKGFVAPATMQAGAQSYLHDMEKGFPAVIENLF